MSGTDWDISFRSPKVTGISRTALRKWLGYLVPPFESDWDISYHTPKVAGISRTALRIWLGYLVPQTKSGWNISYHPSNLTGLSRTTHQKWLEYLVPPTLRIWLGSPLKLFYEKVTRSRGPIFPGRGHFFIEISIFEIFEIFLESRPLFGRILGWKNLSALESGQKAAAKISRKFSKSDRNFG